MFQFSPISEAAYDEHATRITYAKLIPLLVNDFVTRIDSAQMMKANNLPVSTLVDVKPGQGVSVVVPAGTGSTVTPGMGTGTGSVSPAIDSSIPHPSTETLKSYWKGIEEAGGAVTDAIINTSLGK